MPEFLIFCGLTLYVFLFFLITLSSFEIDISSKASLILMYIFLTSLAVVFYLYKKGIIQEVWQNSENRERINVSKCK
jgi:hypothetical protein